MSNAKTKKPPISDAFVHQINILKALSVQRSTSSEVRAVQIEEISELSGVCDDKEIQRYLFILEGQKLVSPQFLEVLKKFYYCFSNSVLLCCFLITYQFCAAMLRTSTHVH